MAGRAPARLLAGVGLKILRARARYGECRIERVCAPIMCNRLSDVTLGLRDYPEVHERNGYRVIQAHRALQQPVRVIDPALPEPDGSQICQRRWVVRRRSESGFEDASRV